MSKAWPKVKLGEVLMPIAREEIVDAEKEYKLLGVRLDGRGPFLREIVNGTQTSAKKLFRVTANDFIYSRLFACRGAFGVIKPALGGCYVSSEFPTFTSMSGKIDVEFLRYWFRRPAIISKVDENCSGSTPLTRNRYKEQFFLQLEIPLPPLAEQQRIVARIEELAAQIREAETLGQQAAGEADTLLISMAHRADLDNAAKMKAGWSRRRLRDVIRFVDNSRAVRADEQYPNLGIYSFGRGLFHKPPIDGIATSAKTLRRVSRGQFIYSRLFAFEGAYGMVSAEFDGKFVSNEYPTFECNPEQARAEFLAAYFKPPTVWKEAAVGSKGLGDRRQRVQPEQILAQEIWLPPISWQNRIAEVQQQTDALKRLQSETAAQLDALLPAILDRAFKGEL